MKYKITFNKDLCIDCGLTSGRCPPQARILARVIGQYCVKQECTDISAGIIPESLYTKVKHLPEACPMNAITIIKVDK